MTLAADIKPGDVFTSRAQIWGEPEMYLVYEVGTSSELVTIRYLYISGPDAGLTYRTMLKHTDDWGDTRLL